MNDTIDISKRRAVIVGMMLLIAAFHIVGPGRYLPGELVNLYYSYFSDLVLPFGAYFLLCSSQLEMPILMRWEVKFATAFLLPSIAETCQYFGIPILGSFFDPLDYLMYGVGALSAAIVETQVFSRIFGFWDSSAALPFPRSTR